MSEAGDAPASPRGRYNGIHPQLGSDDDDHLSLNSLKALDEGALDELLSLGSPDSNGSWRLTNSVHMELQENAKLPTFNWSVDRTGSVDPNQFHLGYRGNSSMLPMGRSHLERTATEEEDIDINWAELFLSSGKRASYNAIYQQAGALKQDIATTQVAARAEPALGANEGTLGEVTKTIDFTMVDPTPLSEIRADEYHHRQVPLPVPGADMPLDEGVVAAAVATAAAIASQQQQQQQTGVAPARSLAAAFSISTTAGRPRGSARPLHGTKHSLSSSQYGFGPRHVVPSVPAPPGHSAGGNKRARKAAQPPKAAPPPPLPPSIPEDGIAAYERKKKRAKDARVRLNESIDRMAIAISLAGTQSKQRVQQWRQVVVATAAPVQMVEACVRTAESAKKWDRPSFVGAAATLIHGLNAQCEALMRELVAVHCNLEATTNGSSTTTIGAPRSDGQSSLAAPQTIAVRIQNSEKRASTPTNVAIKRQRVNDVNDGVRGQDVVVATWTKYPGDENQGSIFSEIKTIERIASYLDPHSLLKCRAISMAWTNAFGSVNEKVWEDLATARFGYFNVRQWRDRMDSGDEGIPVTGMILYKSMDSANVAPHFAQDGLLLLGQARLPGKVSAWTYLVERSNGETLRSVRRESSLPGTGIFTSMPVIELRTVVQSVSDGPLTIRKQTQTVDASTRRRGEEMKEIEWDERFKKRLLNLDGSLRPISYTAIRGESEYLCQLSIFDVVVIVTYIFAKGCSTTSKFVQRSNFTKVLFQISNGTTVPLVIPFPRDAVVLQH
jgi:hypothetical protein